MAATSFNQPPFSADSTSPPTRWDVFLSFRGNDTRFTFTDHLYNALHRSGIKTFRDDPELRSGEVISDGLLQAIQNSKTYVIILSQNYAYSRWCLDELVEIINCYNKMRRLVIPVFYNIDPSTVGHQTGSFGKAFEKHQTRFDKERLHKWRDALTIIGKLSGKVCKNMYEAEFINELVDEILLEINPKTLDVAKYPVGLGPRVKELTSLLSSGTEGVTKIGIYGMGGVGKTTLAKALYNQLLLRSFDGSCFLANVREVSGTTRGLESLQQQLINDVLKTKYKISVHSVEEGIMIMRERLYSAKLLVLIDDIDDLNQYESLVGPFASGSVVIITTRDEEILEKIQVEPRCRYRVNELDDVESLALFTQHAFGSADTDNNFKVLSTEILRLASGLPLALKVFGSHLYKRSKVGWVAYIKKLQQIPNSSIQQRLMISLDALELDDPMLKKIFLDISCFFIGWAIEKVVEILGTYFSYADYCIDILKKRCLLTINDKLLGMHDLLRDMGREIARNGSPDESGKHSRLWVPKEICDVLRNHKGTEAIEVIFHRILRNDHAFATETFRRMRKLRFLHLTGVNLVGSFEHKLENLRWLCWEYCPLECFPSEFNPQALVVLELPCSKMTQMWDLDLASQVFDKLKTLNMSNSLQLTTTPDFAKFPSLETLNLEYCKSLVELNISVGSLGRLVSLNLRGCRMLRSLPDTICNLRALEVLNIGECSNVEALPEELGNIESLKELDAHDVALSELPGSIGRLRKLVKLILTCHEKSMLSSDRWSLETLTTLPDTICNLRELEVLRVGYSRSLAALPAKLGNIESLKELMVYDVIVTKIPDSIGLLSNLVNLRLVRNWNLVTLPNTIGYLRSLEILDISHCESLVALPVELGNLESLKELNAQGVAVSELPNSIGCLKKLVELKLSRNEELKTLPDTICNLRSLEVLHIDNCSNLKALPVELGKIESLKVLHAESIAVLNIPDSIGRLSKLVELRLSGNENLRTLPDTISNMRSLEILDVDDCRSLEVLPSELGNIESLKELGVMNIAVSMMPESIGRLTNLVELRLRGNKNLKTLPSTICNIRSLGVLDISGCEKVEALPDQMWEITRLKELYASGLTMLRRLPDIESTQLIASSLKKLDLSKNVFTALPCGISQLSNLEKLDLTGCDHLSSIIELPSNLKRIKANGCRSMNMLPNLSYLKRLETLDLTDCSGLTDLHGLEGLTSIKILHLGGCRNLSLRKHLFQIYSRLGHDIQISIPSIEFPDWIRESPDWTQNNFGSTISFNFPPNVSCSFLAMILCFKYKKTWFKSLRVRNITSDFIWRTSIGGYERAAGEDTLVMSMCTYKFRMCVHTSSRWFLPMEKHCYVEPQCRVQGKRRKKMTVYVGEEECSKDTEKNRACGFHTGHIFFGQSMISLQRLQTKTSFRNHCCTSILDKIFSIA